MSQSIIDTPCGSTVSAPGREQRVPVGRGLLRPLSWLSGSIPTLLSLAAFGGLFYYGHHFDWKLPKFSAIAGTEAPARSDWCEEHGVPESQCVECNPDLMPIGPDYGWCLEHGVHNCPLEHPDVAQLKETPIVAKTDLQRAARALALRPRPENNAVCSAYQRRIQFASAASVNEAGVDVELVERQPITEWVPGNGEITYDATRLASLSSRLPGTVWGVLKNVGDRVQKGEVLAVVDAMEVGRLKSGLVKALVAEELARQNVDRLRGLSDGVVAGKLILETDAKLARAEAEMLNAEQSLANLGLGVDASMLRGLSRKDVMGRLRFLGLPDDLTRQLDLQTATANLIPIRSPMNGVIVDRQVVAGEVVDPAHTLFQVADTSRMWLMLNIPLEEADLLSIGQSVRFQPDGTSGVAIGTLSWISTAADRQTRMVKVRADLDNSAGTLRDETFGTGQVVLREEPDAIIVPAEAVHWEGCCHAVFVRDKGYFSSPESPKVFHVRSVRIGATEEDSNEIIAGLLPGEVVVTKGSDVLRAQLLKNSLGEGCCAE